MSPELTPWVLFAGFISLLGMTIIIGLRGMLRGSIVAGRHYEDARSDKGGWQKVAETALTANAEQASNFTRLVATVEQLTAVTRETQALVRQLMASERAA